MGIGVSSVLAAITAVWGLIRTIREMIWRWVLSDISDSQSQLSEGIAQEKKAKTPEEAKAAHEKITHNLP